MRNRLALALTAMVTISAVGCGLGPVTTLPSATRAKLGTFTAPTGGHLVVKLRPGAHLTTPVTVRRTATGLGALVIEAPDAETLAALQADPAVEYVEAALPVQLPTLRVRHGISEVQLFKAPPRRATGDPLRNQQYHLDRIHADEAGRLSTGKGVVVAVLDTGVDLGHPDLIGRLTKGFSTIKSEPSPQDLNGHGTHVAGIIAAAAGNRQGGQGVAPDAKIMPVKVLNKDGGTDDPLTIAEGIRWATANGADVINLSLGAPVTMKIVQAAIVDAQAKGVVVVAAMGNEGKDVINYPAAYAGVIAVAATDPNDRVTDFSTSGRHCAVAAPGFGITSTFPTGASTLLALAKEHPDALPPETKIAAGYSAISGTSQASPVIAGVVALIKSLKPTLSPAQIRSLLLRSADPIKADANHAGSGRVNALKALQN